MKLEKYFNAAGTLLVSGALAFSAGCAARRSMLPVPFSEYNKAVEEIMNRAEHVSGAHGYGPDSSLLLGMGCMSYGRDGKPKEIIIARKEMEKGTQTLFFVARLSKGQPQFEEYAMQCKELKEADERKDKK